MALWLRTLICSVLLAAACGCVGPEPFMLPLSHSSRDPRAAQQPMSPTAPGQVAAAQQSPRHPAAAGTPIAPTTPAAPPVAGADPRAQDLNRLMGELQSLGALDPAAQSQLLQDLQQTDPVLWPQMVQMFRASMAYRQRNTQPTIPAMAPAVAPTIQTVAATMPVESPIATQTSASAAAAPPNTPAVSTPATPPARYAGPGATEVPKPAESPPPALVAKPATPTDWKGALSETIVALEKETESAGKSPEDTSRQAGLRMLYLAAGRREDALKPITGATAAEQDFWTQEIYGLATWLDTRGTSDPSRRAAEAATHLNRAMSRLREASPLLVRNVAFCTEVNSYGVYQQFAKNEFKPSQQVILYAEVENFKSDETAKGFHTALRSSYQILDAQGRRIAEQDLKLTEEHCQNPRRDYFVRYFLTLPERLYDGKYTLQLTIEDTLGQKIGQSSIDFLARDK